ncbi:DUF2600 family protein, partial [Bacillus pumilus]|uniref:DUF2600 family protein n=1 Tax=Bacillus pumilus TaxID=1408 RepID=UPI0037047328
MHFSLPQHPFPLITKLYKHIFPLLHHHLKNSPPHPQIIQNQQLPTHPLPTITSKTFHCQPRGILSLLPREAKETSIQFILPYQTITHYLHNLCHPTTSLHPKDFH